MSTMVNGLFPGELLPSTVVGGCIEIFENAWPSPQETITILEDVCASPDSGLSWLRASTIGGGVHQLDRTNFDINITYGAQIIENPVAQNIHNQFYLLLLASTIPYAKKHNITDLYHEDYNILKYKSGQEYKPHFDGHTGGGRAVSAICYLNGQFDGGELEFVNFGVKIKPEPGMLILFPSNYAYTHIAHPVTAGTKYALVTWMRDRIL